MSAPFVDDKWQWLTTLPNPRSRATGTDAGTVGWKTHALAVSSTALLSHFRRARAVCGLLPAHGWGMDLFIERKCARCLRALGIACSVCRGTGTRDGWCSACVGTGLEKRR